MECISRFQHFGAAFFLLVILLAGCNRRNEHQSVEKIASGISKQDVLNGTVMILDHNGNPCACGFFVEDRQGYGPTNTYFVTACHVYRKLNSRGVLSDFRVRQRINGENNDFTIQTSNSQGLLVGEYKRGSTCADVIVVKVANFETIKQSVSCLNPYILNFAGNSDQQNAFEMGDDLLALGLVVPRSEGNRVGDGEIIMQRSSVAALPLSFICVGEYLSELIIAGHQSWPGSSGAPIFKHKNDNTGKEEYLLAGVITGCISRDYTRDGREVHELLALSYVTPFKYIKFAISELNGSQDLNMMKVFSSE